MLIEKLREKIFVKSINKVEKQASIIRGLEIELFELRNELISLKKVNTHLIRNNSSLYYDGKISLKEISYFEDLIEKLNDFTPRLTRNERLICGYLSRDLSSKDIANITGKSTHSIEVARTRLRKKLGINNRKTSITEYIRNKLQNQN